MKKNDLIIICHDENAITWDELDLTLMRTGNSYVDSTIDCCDYENYDDDDIANLTTKIENNWNEVKQTIEKIIAKNEYEYAHKMQGFCMIIEKAR